MIGLILLNFLLSQKILRHYFWFSVLSAYRQFKKDNIINVYDLTLGHFILFFKYHILIAIFYIYSIFCYSLMSADPVTALVPMPGCSMKIFSGDPLQKEVAENVKIGDPLTLVVSLEEQDAYGIRVTDCLVSFRIHV